LLETERFGSVLPTIRSRCQRLSLAAPKAELALQWLTATGVQTAIAEHALRMNNNAPLAARDWLAGAAGDTHSVGLSYYCNGPKVLHHCKRLLTAGVSLNWAILSLGFTA
jgi:hypothetical protein